MAVPEPLDRLLRGGRWALQRASKEGEGTTIGLVPEDTSKKWNTAMAAERAQNLQDTFLNHVRKAKIPLTIFLVNGVKLQGVVTWFDNFCVLLRRDGHSQLVYKHAISTIMPGHPIQLFEGGEEAPAGEKA
jgi:host factor-I protein